TAVLGQQVSMPILVAPTAFQKLAHPDGELATARAAGAAGTVLVLSTFSNTRIEDVMAAASGPVWFQLYIYKDRAATEALVRRVEAAGASALVLTADTPMVGRREADVRNRFALPDHLRIENMLGHGDAVEHVRAPEADSGLAAYLAPVTARALSWRDVTWLQEISRLPVLVKGVVRPDDARRAVDAGAAGVIVSNHGGRQLDGAPATIDVLGPIAEAVGDAAEVLVDGGVRRGTDVIKALALRARAVHDGRPILWGLAAGGEDGARGALELLRRELDLAMALAGCPTVAEVGRDLVRPTR